MFAAHQMSECIRMSIEIILHAIYHYKYSSMHIIVLIDLLVQIQMRQIVKEIACQGWSSSSRVVQSHCRDAASRLSKNEIK